MSSENIDQIQTIDYREKCCLKFVEITKTDNHLALSYLRDTNFDVNNAIEKFYAEENIVIDGHTIRCSDIKVKDFKVISWNLEGLEQKDLQKRTKLAILTIVNSKAKIILLQEIVKEIEAEFRKYFQDNYDIFFDNESEGDYYCAILIKKHPNIKVFKDSFQIKRFQNSKMDRNLLILTITVNKIPIKILTGHLESTKQFSTERKSQLQMAFEEMKKDTDFSIFAGDLNLRDKEIIEIGGVPSGIVDMWETTGKRKEARFTWDPQRNLNASLNCPGAFGQRFDRMYFFSKPENSNSLNIKSLFFGLDGLEKVPSGIRFCSDHWAIVGFFGVDGFESVSNK